MAAGKVLRTLVIPAMVFSVLVVLAAGFAVISGALVQRGYLNVSEYVEAFRYPAAHATSSALRGQNGTEPLEVRRSMKGALR